MIWLPIPCWGFVLYVLYVELILHRFIYTGHYVPGVLGNTAVCFVLWLSWKKVLVRCCGFTVHCFHLLVFFYAWKFYQSCQRQAEVHVRAAVGVSKKAFIYGLIFIQDYKIFQQLPLHVSCSPFLFTLWSRCERHKHSSAEYAPGPCNALLIHRTSL